MLPCRITLYFVIFIVLKFVNGSSILDLGGTWSLKDAAYEYDLFATVPGGVYSDLMDNFIIEDVFYGYNDVNTRWVSKKNWTYSTQVSINESICNYNAINIVFDGVDTFSDIYINNVFVGATDNMFVQYIFDIKSIIQVGLNNFTVNFFSPVEKAELLFQLQLKNYTVPPVCVPDDYNGECHANHVRKMQASFSWDWGPALPSVGIWKPVYLEAYNSSVIRYVTIVIQNNNESDSWDITTQVYLSKPPTPVITGNIIVSLYTDLGRIDNVYEVEVSPDKSGEYSSIQTFSIPKLSVSLWWPNGYGDAVLYKMKVTFASVNGEASIKRFKIGFRTVRLVQNEVEGGRTFYFVVNNIPIFAKGSNAIPINILPERGQDADTIKFLLQSAKDVHMNMIRVWGGGVYESDTFYDTADELGLLIWQDFMFACSMYPTNKEFLRTVKNEVKHQVRRLQYHPSIVVWAANNENEAALRQNWYGTTMNFDLYKRDFIRLYVDVIRKEALKSDRSRPFLTSSPTNGIQSEKEGYIANNPQSQFYGDIHYYNYIANPWDQENYPVSRFASEYGLQSLPAISTLLTATNSTSDLEYDSEFMRHRQHHPAGNAEMELLITEQLHLPNKDSENFYKAFIYYGQIIQAMGMKSQTEFYRIWRSNYDSIGQGLTMGALYWQLNDVWVAPTWSGIDFKMNWKMLHYHAKHFFSPVIITGYAHNNNVDLYVVSDLLTNSYNNSIKISVYKWDSLDVFYQENVTAHVLSGYSSKVFSIWIDKYLSDNGCGNFSDAQYNCFIHLSLHDADENLIAPENFVFPSTLKSSNVQAAIVELESIQQIDNKGKEFQISVKSNGIALFVWLESGSIRGIFSDNGFLQVTNVKTVQFVAESVTTVDSLADAITVTHMLDCQYS